MNSVEATLEFQGCALASLHPKQMYNSKGLSKDRLGFLRLRTGPLELRIKALQTAEGRNNKDSEGQTWTPCLDLSGAFRDLGNVGDPVSCEDRDLSSLYLLECIHISKDPAPTHFP